MTKENPQQFLHNQLISVNDGFEVSYLQQRIGVSREDVLKAIAAVGNGRREVVAYLERLKRDGNYRSNLPSQQRLEDALA